MTNHRPYRAALGVEAAVTELRQGTGRLYDESVVLIVLDLLRENNHQPFWATV